MNRRFLIAGMAALALGSALVVTQYPARAAGNVDINAKIAAAKTAADHESIAAYYDKQASRAHARAEEHAKMAAAYKKMGGTATEKMHLDEHCEKLAKSYEAIATENKSLAEAHRSMAKEAK